MLITKKTFLFIGGSVIILLIVSGTVIFFVYLFYYDNSIAETPKDGRLKLVIDHDGGADDAFAITMSLLYEKYFDGPKVVAITATHGNVNESQVIINSARILDLCGRSDIPIYGGAKEALIGGIQSDHFFGYDGLGDLGYNRPEPVKIQNVHAAVGLIKLSKKYEGELIVIAIGPMTNIALAMRLDPEFIDRLAQIYVGAGHIYSKEHSTPEFNADMDPEAYFIIADNSKVEKVTLCPFSQVYDSLNISKEWRENVLGVIDTPIMKALNEYERLSFAVQTSWILLDPVVAAITLDKSVVNEFRNTRNSIILCGPERGINTNNFTTLEPNARIFYHGAVDSYKKLLIDIYSAELRNKTGQVRVGHVHLKK